jgi:hypothetical protein
MPESNKPLPDLRQCYGPSKDGSCFYSAGGDLVCGTGKPDYTSGINSILTGTTNVGCATCNGAK